MSAAILRIALVTILMGVPKGPETGVIQTVADPGSAATLPAPRRSASGHATWYRWHPGEAAAGPALRRALGRWRGRVVHVNGIPVRLTDWCQCYGSRLVDLDVRTFARIASPSRGVVKVTVTW